MLAELIVADFKRFKEITIPLDKKCLVIYGPNGSGKTQLIWALLLFFRGFNLRFQDCRRYRKESEMSVYKEVGMLLSPHLKDLDDAKGDFKSFAYEGRHAEGKNYAISRFMGKFSDNENVMIEVSLHSNTTLKLEDLRPADFEIMEKVRYAHMGSAFLFETDTKTSIFDDENDFSRMNSFSQSLRHMYGSLDENRKNEILLAMKYVFGEDQVKGIQQGKGRVILVSVGNTELDIMYQGAAFQKVFVTFVLLYLLSSCREKQKYFLVEEPEALLYPGLVMKFFGKILEFAESHDIKVIIVSNFIQIIDSVEPEGHFSLPRGKET